MYVVFDASLCDGLYVVRDCVVIWECEISLVVVVRCIYEEQLVGCVHVGFVH